MTARRWPLTTLTLLLLIASHGSRGAGQAPAEPVAKQPAGLAPLDQASVDQAVEAGVRYLRQNQKLTGFWGDGTGAGSGKGWGVAYTALAGLTLVECGVSTSDPSLKAVRSIVRGHASELENTYEVALAILFLDRMKDKSDAATIRMLAARLIGGQAGTGGWGYKVPKHGTNEANTLLGALRKLSPPQPPPAPSPRERPLTMGLCIKTSDDTFVRPAPPFDPDKARKNAIDSVSPSMKKLPVLQESGSLPLDDPKEKRNDLAYGTTDNSNTHFAILGLWAARKYDVPAERSFALVARRFRTSQGPDGTWAYDYVRKGANGTHAMTCVALLGLAIGHVIDADPNVRPEKDPKVVNAFAALSARVGDPAGRFDNRPTVKDVGGLYFLWAMERIAVLYDVRQLDKKDWYRWGAEILIGHQSQDGSWAEDGGYPNQHPVINTCFALLFLKRANLTPDLSRRLTVDTSVLVAKVDTKVAPPKSEPPPKAVEPTPVVTKTPPKQEQPARPRAETPAVVAEVPPTATPVKEKSNNWIWVVLLVVLAVAGVGVAFFAARRARKDDEDERPRKKKKGVKKKVKVADEDEE